MRIRAQRKGTGFEPADPGPSHSAATCQCDTYEGPTTNCLPKLKILQQGEGGVQKTGGRGDCHAPGAEGPGPGGTAPPSGPSSPRPWTLHVSNLRKLLENVLHQNNGEKKKKKNQRSKPKEKTMRILDTENANHRKAKGILRTRAEGGPGITRLQAWEQAVPTEQRCPGAKFLRNLLKRMHSLMRVILRKIILRGY